MRIEVESTHFPRLTKWHIRRVLKWISQRDIKGLESIRVIDECPDDPEESAKVSRYLRGFLYNGHYSRKTKNQPAQIVLYANDVFFGIPKVLMASSLARLRLADRLAHEVGHHVIATRGYIYKPWEKHKPWDGITNPYEEKMADAYASDVIQGMLGHWRYRLGKLTARMLSTWLYKAGIEEYFRENYQSAASLLSRADTLNHDNEAAGQGFRHAMEKLKTQIPSPLSEVEKEWLINKYNPTPRAHSGELLLTKKARTSIKNRSARQV